ncbi:MAG: hypothetical protein NTW21_15525 [Verrucomicrobia bacterium]|nr:hypothetical protein [Verrucomicrobiota bacterium]
MKAWFVDNSSLVAVDERHPVDHLEPEEASPERGLPAMITVVEAIARSFFTGEPQILHSRGRRDCNLWVRVAGAYPDPCEIKQADGSAWGEWRSTGVCTMIHGVHPDGMNYERSPGGPPVTGGSRCRKARSPASFRRSCSKCSRS